MTLDENQPAAEWVALDALHEWPGNPRRNDENVDRVALSIERFGFSAPIVARRADGEIIAGHTRWRAAHKLGLKRVPVRWMDLDAEAAHLLALADNRLTELSEWDEPTLLAYLGDLRMRDCNAAEVAGWTDLEIDAMLKRAGDDLVGDDAKAGDDDRADKAPVTCPKCAHIFTP